LYIHEQKDSIFYIPKISKDHVVVGLAYIIRAFSKGMMLLATYNKEGEEKKNQNIRITRKIEQEE
jgi:hypothetical protein